MQLKILLSIFLIVLISCQPSIKNPKSLFFGRWVLDSTSGKGGKIMAGGPREHTGFTLRPDGSFTFKWSDFDVSDDYNGNYFYDKKTPMLIFSIYSQERKDSVIRKDSMIVLNLTDSMLKTQEKESYMISDSILITQNRINVYKKN